MKISLVVPNDHLVQEEYQAPECNEDYEDTVRDSERFALKEDATIEEEDAQFDKSVGELL